MKKIYSGFTLTLHKTRMSEIAKFVIDYVIYI